VSEVCSRLQIMLTKSNRAWTQAWMQNEAGFYVTRALIGLCEGAFAPLTVMCLSGFYTNIELGFRIAILSSGINVRLASIKRMDTVSYIDNNRLQKLYRR